VQPFRADASPRGTQPFFHDHQFWSEIRADPERLGEPADWDVWLGDEEWGCTDPMRPPSAAYRRWPVSNAINRERVEGPALLEDYLVECSSARG
jgi:hypothetical protein